MVSRGRKHQGPSSATRVGASANGAAVAKTQNLHPPTLISPIPGRADAGLVKAIAVLSSGGKSWRVLPLIVLAAAAALARLAFRLSRP